MIESTTETQLKCELMDGFAVIVQFFLAVIAFSSLLYKRHREHPQRPVLIWLFDTSKQVLAAVMVHFSNVILSYISGDNSAEAANPCLWYFLNILLDTTIGIVFLYFYLKWLHKLCDYYRIPDMKSGYYGTPPRIKVWIKQTILFMSAWFLVKFTVLVMLAVMPVLIKFATFILMPLSRSKDTRLQVLVVMLFFPLVMNIVQAWLIDMLIKAKVTERMESDEALFENEEILILEPRSRSASPPKRAMHSSDLQPLWSHHD